MYHHTRGIPLSQYISVLPYHRIYRITVSPYHRITVPPYHRTTVPPYHRTTVSPYHRNTVSPYHRITVSPYHRITVPPYHRITVSPYHRITVSPYHRITEYINTTGGNERVMFPRYRVHSGNNAFILCECEELALERQL